MAIEKGIRGPKKTSKDCMGFRNPEKAPEALKGLRKS
jgi:hypothetical protein